MFKLIRRIISKIISPARTPYTDPNAAYISGDSVVGAHTYIGYRSFISKAIIGRYCSIANNVAVGNGEHPINKISTSSLFYDDAYTLLTAGDCIIGNDVWIGVNSTIRRGVTIGNGAVVGANSFVTRDVPPFAVVGGSPAKIITYRFNPRQIAVIQASKWWDYDLEEARLKMQEVEIKINQLQ